MLPRLALSLPITTTSLVSTATPGVVGFTPGPTDIVPPAGVQLSNILNPVLAFNGGPTQTHALVPGSPAIDAGGAVCTDANGNPLLTDQRGKPRIVDGNGDGTARCDIGAFEFFPVVNNFVTLDPGLDTAFNSDARARRVPRARSPSAPRSPTQVARRCAFLSLR